jgi:F-type H+-transporting ATPase subunit c
MNPESATIIAKAICILGMAGTAIGEGRLVAGAFEAIGRNPKLEDTLFSKAIVAIALVESTAIYSLVAFFIL